MSFFQDNRIYIGSGDKVTDTFRIDSLEWTLMKNMYFDSSRRVIEPKYHSSSFLNRMESIEVQKIFTPNNEYIGAITDFKFAELLDTATSYYNYQSMLIISRKTGEIVSRWQTEEASSDSFYFCDPYYAGLVEENGKLVLVRCLWTRENERGKFMPVINRCEINTGKQFISSLLEKGECENEGFVSISHQSEHLAALKQSVYKWSGTGYTVHRNFDNLLDSGEVIMDYQSAVLEDTSLDLLLVFNRKKNRTSIIVHNPASAETTKEEIDGDEISRRFSFFKGNFGVLVQRDGNFWYKGVGL